MSMAVESHDDRCHSISIVYGLGLLHLHCQGRRERILWPWVWRQRNVHLPPHPLPQFVGLHNLMSYILLLCRWCFLENPVPSNEWDGWDVQEICISRRLCHKAEFREGTIGSCQNHTLHSKTLVHQNKEHSHISVQSVQ